MKFLDKKAVIFIVAVVTIMALANFSANKKFSFPVFDRVLTVIMAPFQSAVSKVGYTFRNSTSFISDIFTVYRDNQILKAENQKLSQNTVNMTEILAENARLRTILDYKKGAPQFDFVVAEVIARDSANWLSSIVINRGEADGLAKDMTVVTPQGLVGSITKVYQHQSRVQLILNPKSAVGGLVQRAESRVAAIVVGNSLNAQHPRMINIARDADIVKDDVIITSGFGGIYPKGIVIGHVTDIVNEEGGLLKYAVLKPAVDFDKLEEVLVIKNTLPAVRKGEGL